MGDLSAVSAPHDTHQHESTKTSYLSGKRFLVASSDERVNKACLVVAKSYKSQLEMADSGVAALVAARTILPDLIFLDMELRDVHGMEWMSWLRSNAELGRIPVLAFSSFMSEQNECRTKVLDSFTILAKPIQVKDVTQWVSMVLVGSA